MKPYCFQLMPCAAVDFDRIHHQLVKPAIKQANLEPVTGGINHKPMFDRHETSELEAELCR